jgi:hypothetical protein
MKALHQLPMTRSPQVDPQGLFERKEVLPSTTGVIERRPGTARSSAEPPASLGLTKHGIGGCLLLEDSYDAVFTGTDFTVGLDLRFGGLGCAAADEREFTLFRWGDINHENGEILWTIHFEPTEVHLVAYLTDSVGTTSITYVFPAIPDAEDTYRLYLRKVSNSWTLWKATGDGSDASMLAVDNSVSWTPSIATQAEASFLGKSFRASTYITVDEPHGSRPALGNLSIWSDALTTAEMGDYASVRLEGTETGLEFCQPLTAGTESLTNLAGSDRLFLVPSQPVLVDGGAIFSGSGGYARVPSSTLFDPFFITKTGSGSARGFAASVQLTTPDSLEFYDEDGAQTTATLLHWPGLLHFYLSYSSGWKVCADLETDQGTVSHTTHTTSLSAGTDYTISFERTDDYCRIVVNGTSVDVAVPTEYGPQYDPDLPPEIYLGIHRNTTPGYEKFDSRFKGLMVRAYCFPHSLPISALAAAGLESLRTDDALFAIDFTRAAGDRAPDISGNGLTAFFEVDDYAGLHHSPPYWTRGPIPDGEFVAARAGYLLEEGRAQLPDESGNYSAMLNRKFDTDATIQRIGDRAICVSNDRAHLLDDISRRIRPLGLPQPTSRPGAVPTGYGIHDGVCAYGYYWVSRDGSRSPLRQLPPVHARNAMLRIGSDSYSLGGSYIHSEDSSGNKGYLTLDDAKSGAGYAVLDDEHTLEAQLRLSPDVDLSEVREEVWDRGFTGGSAWEGLTMGWKQSLLRSGTEALTHQFTFRFDDTPPASHWADLFSLASNDGYLNSGAKYVIPPAYALTIYNNAGTYELRLRSCNDKDQGYLWGNAGTWFDNTTATGFSFTQGYDYQVFLTHDGSGTFTCSVLERDSSGTETWYDDVISATKSGYDARGREYFPMIGGHDISESDAGGVDIWLPPENIVKNYRCWKRILSSGDFRLCRYTHFDPIKEAGLTDELVHDLQMIDWDPSSKREWVYDSARGASWQVWKKENNWRDWPIAGSASVDWTLGIEDGTTYLWTFEQTSGSGSPDLTSPLSVFYSRIGDGSLNVFAGDEPVFQGAREPEGQTNSAVADLEAIGVNPQTFNWFTFWVDHRDTGTATPDLTIKQFWLNGVDRGQLTSGTFKERDTATEAFRMGDYQGVAPWPVDIGEVRLWSGRQYEEPQDFQWLYSRVPGSEWSNLQGYYQQLELTAGSPDYIANIGTASPTAGGLLLDTNEYATLTQLSVRGLPVPPTPDIVAIGLTRTAFLGVNDPLDTEEVSEQKRIVSGRPHYELAEIPVGQTSFLDNIPSQSLGPLFDQRSGWVPRHVKGVGHWNGRFVLFGDPLEPRTLFIAESGPFGFESYPDYLRYRVPADQAGEITALLSLGQGVVVFGSSWAVQLGGAPEAPQFRNLGSGIGSYSARTVCSGGGYGFAFNGTLWVFNPERPAEAPADFGAPVQDLLPDASNCRLEYSSRLASLLVFDESSGEVLRFHFPTKGWYRESRSARSLTDYGSSTYWVHLSGRVGLEGSGFGDDLLSGQDASHVATGGGAQSVTVTGPLPTSFAKPGSTTRYYDLRGQRGLLIRAADSSVEAFEIAESTASSIFPTSAWSGTAPVSGDTVLLGVDDEGLILDSGIRKIEGDTVGSSSFGILSGSNWQLGVESKGVPGDPTSRAGIAQTDYLAIADESRIGIGHRHRNYHRMVVRNLHPEEAKLTFWGIDQ